MKGMMAFCFCRRFQRDSLPKVVLGMILFPQQIAAFIADKL